MDCLYCYWQGNSHNVRTKAVHLFVVKNYFNQSRIKGLQSFVHSLRSVLEKFPNCFSYKTTKHVETINLCSFSKYHPSTEISFYQRSGSFFMAGVKPSSDTDILTNLMNFDHCSVFLWGNLLKREIQNNHWGPHLNSKVDDEATHILNCEQ